jgi:hypothetical protein
MSSSCNYIKFRYTKGLCNNLFKLFTAVRIAEVEGKQLVEPVFKWGRKPAVQFSDIYDLGFFNTHMRVGNKPMVVLENELDSALVDDRSLTYDLWKGSRNIYDLRHQRAHNRIPRNCPSVRVLRALKIHPQYQPLLDAQPGLNAIHVRWEWEWIGHAQKRQPGLPPDETMLVPPEDIAAMYATQHNTPAFFTTGAGHNDVQTTFSRHNIDTTYFYDSVLAYDINAAVNFAICVNAPLFIGNSRSTFSNLIALARHLENSGPSYIYNYQGRFMLRTDAGLHFEGPKVVQEQVVVEDRL